MKKHPLKDDQRYTVTLEYCGEALPRYIVRFCDDFVSSHSTYSAAVVRATGHRAVRQGALVITEKTH